MKYVAAQHDVKYVLQPLRLAVIVAMTHAAGKRKIQRLCNATGEQQSRPTCEVIFCRLRSRRSITKRSSGIVRQVGNWSEVLT